MPLKNELAGLILQLTYCNHPEAISFINAFQKQNGRHFTNKDIVKARIIDNNQVEIYSGGVRQILNRK